MQIKVLGTQAPYARFPHNRPGFLITTDSTKIMLDCGNGTTTLINMQEDLKNLIVIISHLHHDHYGDLGTLINTAYSFRNLKQLSTPLKVYIPASPKERFLEIIKEEFAFADYHEIHRNNPLEIGNLTISFLSTVHSQESYAIRITDGKHTIVYTSDISFANHLNLIEFAKEADLFICEASLLREHGFPEINSHITAYQAAILAKEAQVKKLLLTHLWPDEDPKKYLEEAKLTFDNVQLAKEGQIFDFIGM